MVPPETPGTRSAHPIANPRRNIPTADLTLWITGLALNATEKGNKTNSFKFEGIKIFRIAPSHDCL